jgi:hypothetical protein
MECSRNLLLRSAVSPCDSLPVRNRQDYSEKTSLSLHASRITTSINVSLRSLDQTQTDRSSLRFLHSYHSLHTINHGRLTTTLFSSLQEAIVHRWRHCRGEWCLPRVRRRNDWNRRIPNVFPLRVNHSRPFYYYVSQLLTRLLVTLLALTDSQGSGCSQGTPHLQDDGGVVVESSVASNVRRPIVD